MDEKIKRLREKAYNLRKSTLDMCVKAGTGHVTSSFSCAEIFSVLFYGDVLRYDPKNPRWGERDRFILSKGQASPILYAALADVGYYPKEWLDTFCQKNGKFGVHLQNDVPGVEISSGSLGHGLGIAAGIALAGKMDKRDYFTFVLLGDGECYEGSVWESAMFASHNHLNNLIAIVDRNWQCATDFTEDCLRLSPLDKKWGAFGWDVKNVYGHSIKQLLNALDGFRSRKSGNPYVIIADTIKGKGSPLIESQVMWHARAPNEKEADIIRRDIEEYCRREDDD